MSKHVILPVPTSLNFSKYWFDNNPSLTNFMIALSSLFPEGEKFFMKSVADYIQEYPDFRDEIITFCKQERNHTEMHKKMNYSGHNAELVKKLERMTGVLLDNVSKYTSKRQRLVITTCLEHITATIAEELIKRTDLQAKMDPDMKTAWIYHAIEETSIPHKNVAYSLYSVQGVSEIERKLFMFISTITLGLVVALYWTTLMANDKTLRGTFSFYKTMIQRRGFLTGAYKEYKRFYEKGFYPVKVEDFY